MTMQVSKGEFDRRVKLLEQKVQQSANKLINDYKEFVERINSITSDNADFNRYAAIVDRINSCFDTNGQFDGSHIAPLSIETSALSVGQRSQALNLKNVKFDVKEYTRDTNNYGVLSVTDENNGTSDNGLLTHYTLFNNEQGEAIGNAEFNITYSNISLSNNTALHYIYAKLPCTKSSDGTYIYSKVNDNNPTAEIIVDINQKTIEGGDNFDGFLWILLGTISKEFYKSGGLYRIVDLNYGLTTINGRLITTGRIEGSIGNNPAYIDLDLGEIGGCFELFTASSTTDEGETYVRSGMSGITDYPSLWAGGSLTEATKVSEFRNAYYQYPSKPTATNIPASNVPFETPYSVHMFDYTISNGYRVFTNTRKSFLSALRDCEWTRGVYMGDVFKVPNAFIDHLGNSKFGSFYVERDGSLIIGNVKIDKNGQWSNTLTTFIGSASIGDATHHIYWDGSTFVQAASSFLPLAGGTMTGTINSQSILPKTTNTYDIGNESYNYSYGCFNILYPGTNNNLWLRSNATSGSTTGIVFGYGGKISSTTLGKWTYTGLGIGTDSPAYKLDVAGTANITGNTTIGGYLGLTQTTGAGVGISLYGNPPSSGLPYYGLVFAKTSTFGNFGDVQGDWATYFTMYHSTNNRGWIFRRYDTSTNVASLSTLGNFCAMGGVTALATASSDKRLKKEIKPFNAKQIIDKLKPVEFEWNKKANKYNSNLELNKKNYGLIAQDSDGIIDNFVFDLPDGKGYKGVRYEKLIPILLQAIKEQQAEINKLKKILKCNEL